MRHPAPALEIGEDGVDRLIRLLAVEGLDGLRCQRAGDFEIVLLLEFLHRFGQRLVVGAIAGNAEPVAQFGNAAVLLADLRRRAVGDLRLARIALAGAQLGEFFLERLVLRHLRFEGVERGSRILLADHARQHVGRLRGFDVVVGNVRAHPRPVHAADRRVVRVSDHRHRELQIGFRELGRIGRGKVRHRVVSRIETVGIDMREIIDRGLGAGVGFAVGDPERRVVTAGIERIDDHAIFLAAEDLVELAAGHGAELIGNGRVRRTQIAGRSRSGSGLIGLRSRGRRYDCCCGRSAERPGRFGRGGRRRRGDSRCCFSGRRRRCRRGAGRYRSIIRCGRRRCRISLDRYGRGEFIAVAGRQIRGVERLRRQCVTGGLTELAGMSRDRRGGENKRDGRRGKKLVESDTRHCKVSS